MQFKNLPMKIETHYSQSTDRGSSLERTHLKTSPKPLEKSIHFSKLNTSSKIIEETFDEIKGERISRMVGLISHFVYWCVFGHINRQPLDDYHMK